MGLSQETILRNTMGLKSVVGSLLEARSAGGPTRPNETNAPGNRRRKSYSALYTFPGTAPGREPAAGRGAGRGADPRPAAVRVRVGRAAVLGAAPDGRPVGERLAAHGIEVKRKRRAEYHVAMRQPQRGLIPLLLDGQAAEPMVAAERVMCQDDD